MKLRQLWQHWVRAAKVIAEFQARLMLTIFYFLIMGPVALCFRLFSDPLHLRRSDKLYWPAAPVAGERNLADAKKQY